MYRLFALLVALLLIPFGVAAASPVSPPPLVIRATASDVVLAWHASASLARSLTSSPPPAPLALSEIGDAVLPAHLVAVRLAGAPVIRITALESIPWNGSLNAITRPCMTPIVLSEGVAATESRCAPAVAPTPPTAPLVLLRMAQLRGVAIAVFALSPIFTSKGELRIATRLEAQIPQAQIADLATYAALATNGPWLTAAPLPINPAANQVAARITVAQAGLQRLPIGELRGAGLAVDTLGMLQLDCPFGHPALDVTGSGDGRTILFYVPQVGDRWNSGTYCWMRNAPTVNPLVTVRDVSPGAAPVRATANERGVWRKSILYDSTTPGPDGDHWFASDLRAMPGLPPVSTTLIFTPTLPLASGQTVITPTGATYLGAAPWVLSAAVGNRSSSTRMLAGVGDWTRPFTLPRSGTIVTLTLAISTTALGVELDSLAWTVPVTLQVGADGASFAGVAGRWRYQIAGMASEQLLYDVTDPLKPQRLTGVGSSFEDGPTPRDYLLTGTQTLHTPTITAHTPHDSTAPLTADALYVAPSALVEPLAPLLALRRAQGYTVAVVDPQTIYDAWSFGLVDPEAIRSFLRTSATWPQPPKAVTLVGDGTLDPFSYQGHNNPNLIPPYLAMVDPGMGETACDACYARLDGDDPRSDPLPDLWIGRFPVRSVADVQLLVQKIVGYETDGSLAWRSRSLFVADNYRQADGSVDGAGDFAAYSEQSIALQPAGMDIQRLYYDPLATASDPAWYEPAAAQAHARTLAELEAGAGLVVYTGHGHQWQWAVTDVALPDGYLLGLYDPDQLQNSPRLPIVIELTCLTAAFQLPAYGGMVLDERMLMSPRGGAVALWGPTGLSIVNGHDALQRGFQQALWAEPRMQHPLGALTLAGDLELYSHAGCCQDALATFLLLGDPLTNARIGPVARMYVPWVQR